MTVQESAKITDGELDRLRQKIGQVIKISEVPYLTETSRDAVRRWALATGDRNPLYFDEAAATRSRYGGLIAPPCLPYAFSRLSIGYRGGLPGVHSMFGGSHWKWHRPVSVGKQVSHETRFEDLIELQGRFAGRMFRQVSLTTFTAEGESSPFAEVRGWGMRVERDTARKKKKYQQTDPPSYSPADIAAIADEYANEFIRGADLLYWQDVEVGERLPATVRGPYTPTIAVAFEQAFGGLFIHAHGYWFDFLKQHPAGMILNDFGVPEPPEAVHWDNALARGVGVPQAYDYGPERISWIATTLTNWIGSEGFLEELYCEIRRFNLVGDLTRCQAEVENVLEPEADGRGRVRLRVWAENQRGEETAKGWAVVSLPSR
ncbi:FAS1-like dehydratase domain-containing protein [Pseudonocardia sp. GCM10023141]|uniref:FAS1-like dehydratase domain-containing protein n=1 Tax=Pseudonocardia sp. GCM10023141 TaxID=3252653 RepID=UPI00362274DD